MDCPPIPQFFPNFLLRSKTYLKECPPSASASVANREFPLQARRCGETGLHTLQGANYTAAWWFTLVQGA